MSDQRVTKDKGEENGSWRMIDWITRQVSLLLFPLVQLSTLFHYPGGCIIFHFKNNNTMTPFRHNPVCNLYIKRPPFRIFDSLIRSFMKGPLSNLPLAVTFIPRASRRSALGSPWPCIDLLTLLLFMASSNAVSSKSAVQDQTSISEDKSYSI